MEPQGFGMTSIERALSVAKRVVGKPTVLLTSPEGVVRVVPGGVVFSTPDRIVTTMIRCEHSVPDGVYPIGLLIDAVGRGGTIRVDDGRIRVGRWSAVLEDRCQGLSWLPPTVPLEEWPDVIGDLALASVAGRSGVQNVGTGVLISRLGVARVVGGVAAATRGDAGRDAIPESALKAIITVLTSSNGPTRAAWAPSTLLIGRGDVTVRILRSTDPPSEYVMASVRETAGILVPIDEPVFKDGVATASALGSVWWDGDRIHGRKGAVRVSAPAGGVAPLSVTIPEALAAFVAGRDGLTVRISIRGREPDRIQVSSGDSVLTAQVRRPDPA